MIIDSDRIKALVEYHLKNEKVNWYDNPKVPQKNSTETDEEFQGRVDAFNILDPDDANKYKAPDSWSVKKAKSISVKTTNYVIPGGTGEPEWIKDPARPDPVTETKTNSWNNQATLTALRDTIANVIYDVLTDSNASGTFTIPGEKLTTEYEDVKIQKMVIDPNNPPEDLQQDSKNYTEEVTTGAVEGQITRTAPTGNVILKPIATKTIDVTGNTETYGFKASDTEALIKTKATTPAVKITTAPTVDYVLTCTNTSGDSAWKEVPQAFKVKTISFTSGAVTTTTGYAHGIDYSKIVSINVVINWSGTSMIMPGFVDSDGSNVYLFTTFYDDTNVYVAIPTASTAVASKPGTITILYRNP